MVYNLRKKKSNRSRLHLVIGAVGVFFVAGIIILSFKNNTGLTASVTNIFSSTPEEIVSKDPVTIVLVGDIMMDRGVRRKVEQNLSGDYNALFQNTPYIKDADIAFGNLEGPVADTTVGKLVGSRFSFRMSPLSLNALSAAGFDVVSFANNHVGDYAQSAFMETFRLLKENSILYAGAGEHKYDAAAVRIQNVRGTKIGFLATSDVGPAWMEAGESTPGILLADDPDLSGIISRAKAEVDILIVSVHFGDEYSPVSVRQEKLAHMIVDSGADVVVGAHPHVMQKFEDYKGKQIFYSLGNFIFDQYFSVHTMRGMVVSLSIDPQTKTITQKMMVSPLSKNFVPQPLVPFEESMLVTKTFTP